MKKKTNKAAFYKVETSPRLRMRLPLACYLAALLLWMLYGAWGLASDALSGLTQTDVPVTDFQLVGLVPLEDAGENWYLTTDGDPQLLLEDVGQTVRTVSYAADFVGDAREMCLYYTTKVGEPYSRDRRVFPETLPDGSYRYTLPRGPVVSLRLDPCSPDENKQVRVGFAGGVITLNRRATLPGGLDYFIPSWYQAFCLLLYPALAAAALNWAVHVMRRLRGGGPR